MSHDRTALLSIRGLKTHLPSSDGLVRAVDGVDLDIYPGETFGLVGESGCGKSMTALSIMRLLPGTRPPVVAGSILFEGKDLLTLSPRQMRSMRGNRIGMIFQEPMTSLNPVFTVGRQIAEALQTHRGLGRKAAREEAVALLDRVGIPAPRQRAREHPHRLSGGMRQRAMIAMAIACRPRLLIADEPTTALDVTIQAQILDLIQEIKTEVGMAVLLITHNFGIIAETADRTAVMYAGRVVEEAPTRDLFAAPTHPYTHGLLRSMPRIGDKALHGRRPLHEIPGIVPRLTVDRTHCSFAPRCFARFPRCLDGQPEFSAVGANHHVRCYAHEDGRLEAAEARVAS